MEYKKAFKIAARLVERLEPYCERVAIAGSVRRKRPEAKDIEICAIPRLQMGVNLFDEPIPTYDLSEAVSSLGRFIKNGPKYKQIYLPEGVMLDLFLVTPPAQWGVLFVIRTGPAEFSQMMVTTRQKGGWLPSYCKPVDGIIMTDQGGLVMPEEVDYFRLCGLPMIPPERRAAYLEDYKTRRKIG